MHDRIEHDCWIEHDRIMHNGIKHNWIEHNGIKPNRIAPAIESTGRAIWVSNPGW